MCSLECPTNAITMTNNKYGFLNPQIDDKKCISCGKCFSACPINHVSERPRENDLIKIMQNTSREILSKSSSGGVFYQLSQNIINRGGYVFACNLDDQKHAKHDVFSNINEITGFMGSKYIQSQISYILPVLKRYLDNGNLCLFVGTGCQIASVKTYLGKEYNNLYTVNIVCHGVPSNIIYDKYLDYVEKTKKEKVKTIKFRHKSANSYGILINDKYFYDAKSDIFYNLYLSNLFLRPSCYNCKFKESKSCSDITIGDAWNEKTQIFDKTKGASLLVINSYKGHELYRDICDSFLIDNLDGWSFGKQFSYSKSPIRPSDYLISFEKIKKHKIKSFRDKLFSKNIFRRVFRYIKRRIL